MKNQNSPSAPTPKKRKRLFPTLLRAAALVLFTLLFLLVGIRRPPALDGLATYEETQNLMQVTAKLSNAMFSARQTQFAEDTTIELTPGEVDAILHTALRACRQRYGRDDTPLPEADWRDGAAEVKLSYPLPGGLAVNFRSRAVPDLRDGQLVLRCSGTFAGWLFLPGAAVDPAVAAALERLKERGEYRLAVQAVNRIAVLENGNLAVTFSPRQAGTLLMLLMRR